MIVFDKSPIRRGREEIIMAKTSVEYDAGEYVPISKTADVTLLVSTPNLTWAKACYQLLNRIDKTKLTPYSYIKVGSRIFRIGRYSSVQIDFYNVIYSPTKGVDIFALHIQSENNKVYRLNSDGNVDVSTTPVDENIYVYY